MIDANKKLSKWLNSDMGMRPMMDAKQANAILEAMWVNRVIPDGEEVADIQYLIESLSQKAEMGEAAHTAIATRGGYVGTEMIDRAGTTNFECGTGCYNAQDDDCVVCAWQDFCRLRAGRNEKC